MPDDEVDDDKGGGGGSGFVYTKNTASSVPIGYLLSGKYYLTQAETKQGTVSFISPNNTTETGHSGDGYVRITVGEDINDLRRRKSARIQQKGSSSTEWDPDTILLSREIGIETDTNKMKIGDGITPWSSLPYCNNSASDEEIKRIKYYGDPDIIPSDESWFTTSDDGSTITGLTDAGKTQTELVIPYKIDDVEITSISDGAFSDCTSLTSINIPNSVTGIGYGAFYKCTSLTSINIPNSVTSISDDTFSHCTSLSSINIPNSVTGIGYAAFSHCTSLSSINLSNKITLIGPVAFYNCTSLKSINIPNSITWLYDQPFGGCTNLTIYCEQGSYAETYAKENNISVVYTDVKPTSINPIVKTSLEETTSINTIYDLALRTELNITLPSGQIGDFIEFDFISGETATNLTVNSSSGFIGFDLIPEMNTIYTLYFDWGVAGYDGTSITYGWRCNYSEYSITI